jgi:hypothetical protein
MALIPFIDPGVEINYIPITPDAIPYQFQIQLIDRTYTLVVKWSDYSATYTLDLITLDGIVLSYGDPVRYGRQMFGNVEDERYPLPVIIPYCFAGTEEEVTHENFGRTVQLYMFDRASFLDPVTASGWRGGELPGSMDDAVPVIPPMPPDYGAAEDEFAPYYHLHTVESIVDLPVRLARLGHAPIPLDIVSSILGNL